jgi:flagellar hook protein FlgE
MQIGRGVGLAAVPMLFGQGSFLSTQSATDLAIDGDGFFMVNDADGDTYYTRAGMFTIDRDEYLVDVNGYRVQTYIYENGVSTDVIGDISLGGVQSDPASTTRVSIGANLNAEAAEFDTFVSALTVYDSLGAEHTLTLTFEKNDVDFQWTVEAELSGLDPTDVNLDVGAITFDENGKLAAATDVNITITVPLPGGDHHRRRWRDQMGPG